MAASSDQTTYATRFGGAIREIREIRQLTQGQLANRIDVSVNFLSQVENGRRSVSPRTLEALSKALDVPRSFFYLLSEDGTKKPIGVLQSLVMKSLNDYGSNKKCRGTHVQWS